MSLISLHNIHKHYGEGQAKVPALRGVDLAVNQGEFLAVMGPSGSGKSTLLSVLGALNTPNEGRYVVDDIDIYSLSSDQQADFRREYLGFVFQSFNLVPYLSLAENVMLPLVTKKLSSKEKLEMAHEALGKVGLAGKEERLPNQCSGGEQERAAVARALVNRPPILLADEPTGNLDRRNTEEVMELLRHLGSEGMTIIMVTHSPDCASYADRIIQMEDGVLAGEERRYFPRDLAAAGGAAL